MSLLLILAALSAAPPAESRIDAALSACERVMREGPMPLRYEGIEGLTFDPARDVWFWQGDGATVAVHAHIGHRWCAAYFTRNAGQDEVLDRVRAWSARRGYDPMSNESLQFGGSAERWRFEYRDAGEAARVEFLYTADR